MKKQATLSFLVWKWADDVHPGGQWGSREVTQGPKLLLNQGSCPPPTFIQALFKITYFVFYVTRLFDEHQNAGEGRRGSEEGPK